MKTIGVKFWLGFLAMGCSGLIQAQTISVKASIDSTDKIKIGEQVKLRLEVDQPKNMVVTMPVFSDTVASAVEWVETLKTDSTINGDNLHILQDYVITSFDSGCHRIAPIEIVFSLQGHTDTLRTEPLFLKVFTIPVDTTKEIKDIHAPYSAPWSFADIWLYLVIALALIIVGLGIWFFTKLRKNEPIFASYKSTDPAHVIALRNLDALRAEKVWQQGKEKQYYTRLSDIIRLYIETRFHVAAPEMTSDEIITAMKKVKLESFSDIDLLVSLFTTADLVKFAKARPLPDENEVAILNAYQFVNNTKPFVSVDTKQESEDASSSITTE